MQLHIHHFTCYSYPNEVFLEPHYLCFHPLHRPYLDLKKYDIKIKPEPDGLFELIDIENNMQHQCWFNKLLTKLEIDVDIVVNCSSFNPFGFYIDRNINKKDHAAYNNYLEIIESSVEVEKFLQRFREKKDEDLLSTLSGLLADIHSNWDHTLRYEDDLHSPTKSFKQKKGSCRDLAWMLINMLRQLDIPSRFVSGYAFNPDLGEGHELHAWVEAMITGGGWIGMDPSAGIFVNEAYIPVSCSYLPKNTLPVTGNYRGSVPSDLKTKITIEKTSK